MAYRHFIKNHNAERTLLYRRLLVLTLIVIALSGALIARLIYLQINQYDNFSQKADHNQFRLEPIAPKRGRIYDRNHQLLAENITAYRIDINPKYSHNLTQQIKQLSTLLHLSLIHI